MKRFLLILTMVQALFLMAVAASQGSDRNRICPVMGNEIDDFQAAARATYEGKTYYFCCPACVDIFNKDPRKYVARLQEQWTCPVDGKPFLFRDGYGPAEFEGKEFYFCSAACRDRFATEPEAVVFKDLPKPGKEFVIAGGLRGVYTFSERPKLGTIIMKIRVLDAGGRQVTPFAIQGRLDMPEMRGAHDSGSQDFKLNRKGDYLLPLGIVMPGGWEVRLTFRRGGKAVFHGSARFDV